MRKIAAILALVLIVLSGCDEDEPSRSPEDQEEQAEQGEETTPEPDEPTDENEAPPAPPVSSAPSVRSSATQPPVTSTPAPTAEDTDDGEDNVSEPAPRLPTRPPTVMVTTTPSGTSMTPVPSLPTAQEVDSPTSSNTTRSRRGRRVIRENLGFTPTRYLYIHRERSHEAVNGATRPCMRAVIDCRGNFEPGDVVTGPRGVTVYQPHGCNPPPAPPGRGVGWQLQDNAGHGDLQQQIRVDVSRRGGVQGMEEAADVLTMPPCSCAEDRTSDNHTPAPTTPRPARRDTRTHH